MEPEGLLTHIWEPATCPYSEPEHSSPWPPIPFHKDQSSYYSPIYAWALPNGLFPSGFSTKPLYAPLPHTCYIPLPSHSSLFDHPNRIWQGIQIIKLLMQFSPFPCCPWTPIFSSAPYSPTPSVYICPSMRVTKFHTYAKQHAVF